MAKLDELLSLQAQGSPPSPGSLAKVKGELTQPRRSWKRDARVLMATTVTMSVALTVVLLLTGNSSLALVKARLPFVLPLLYLGAVGAWYSIAPQGRSRRHWFAFIVFVVAVGMVSRRGEGLASAQPEWVCTVSHLALGTGPLGLALVKLRRSAWNGWRSLAAGLSVGTVGAVAGEVGCTQGWSHVLVFHLTPWLAVAAVALLVSRRLARWSFAP